MRENAEAKARRYLAEGRLTLRALSTFVGIVTASCRGGGKTYTCGRDEYGVWYCDCQARGRCSHLIALKLVVSFEEGGGAGPRSTFLRD